MDTLRETSYGTVRGVEADGLFVFRGIPFARPPAGRLRFRPPEPPPPWTGVRDASRFGPAAPQNVTVLGPLFRLGTPRTGEDCLYLNVWTPGLDGGRRPVLAWIHGGAFILGAGSQPLYDGSALARRGDVVVVTINYRLGALGFLHLKERCGERIPATGNEGILDQIAALQWVRDEIAAFGGDPANVTIFGESAGAMSCATLLGTPRARGLFHRAILQSGSANYVSCREDAARIAEALLADPSLDPASADDLLAAAADRILQAQQRLFLALVLGGQHLLATLSPRQQRLAAGLFMMLSLPRRRLKRTGAYLYGRLVEALKWRRGRGARRSLESPAAALAGLRSRGLPFQPVVDGNVLPRHPFDAIRDGLSGHVPVLVGTNLDEAKLFTFADPEVRALDEAELIARCREALAGTGLDGSDAARRATEVYRQARAARGENIEPSELWLAIESDRTMRYPAMRLAELQRDHQPRTYAYLFTWPSPLMGGLFGACHALELPFVFGTLHQPLVGRIVGAGSEAQALAYRIQDAWIAFARSGDPSHPGIGDWPAYDRTRRATMILDRRCRVEEAPREAERAFWASLDAGG
jgi:para-nitrobenzyl esterase